MKRFLYFMAIVFLILTIICYTNSVRSIAGLDFNVTNIQMTVFSAAFAILCAINFIGALIISAIDNISLRESNPTTESEVHNDSNNTKNDSSHINSVPHNDFEIYAKPNEVIFCDLCGVRKSKLTKVSMQTRKGPQEKKICDKCMSENSDKILS